VKAGPLLLALGLVLPVFATAQGAPSPPKTPRAQPLTIQAIMDQFVDPAADGIWGSVGEIESKGGVQHNAPKTPADWSHVRVLAGQLAEGAAALRTPRPVGDNGGRLADANAPGARTAADITREIAADPAKFHAHADRLRQAAERAARAADAKDADALLKAGGAIDAACESCHATYWYPKGKLALPSVQAFTGVVLGRP
jgi:cytochrome c556